MSATMEHDEEPPVRVIMRLRTHGHSTVLTIPPQALDAADFESGDRLYIEAREGELRLTPAHDVGEVHE